MKPQAEQSLLQARAFLDAAELLQAQGLTNPSVSAAIHAAIHAKDPLCIEVLGTTKGTKNHAQAIKELESTGLAPRRQLEQFSSVIASKSEAEYGSRDLSEAKGQVVRTQAIRFCHFVMDLLKFVK